MQQPRNPSDRETQIPQYLAAQIHIEILVGFEFVPRNSSFSIWWISGVWQFQWKLHMLCVILDMCSDISLCLACVCPRPLAACKHMAWSCLLLCQPSFRPCVVTYPHSAGPAIFLKTNGGGGVERWGGGSMGRKCWVCAGIECRVCRFDEGILNVRVKE